MTLGLQDLPSKDFPTGTPMPNLKKPTLDKDLDTVAPAETSRRVLNMLKDNLD